MLATDDCLSHWASRNMHDRLASLQGVFRQGIHVQVPSVDLYCTEHCACVAVQFIVLVGPYTGVMALRSAPRHLQISGKTTPSERHLGTISTGDGTPNNMYR